MQITWHKLRIRLPIIGSKLSDQRVLILSKQLLTALVGASAIDYGSDSASWRSYSKPRSTLVWFTSNKFNGLGFGWSFQRWQFSRRLANLIQDRIDWNSQNSGNIPNPRIIQSHRNNQRTNKMATTLISIIGNKLFVAIFTEILLLFILGFAILFKIERRTIWTSYLFVTHIT